MATMGEDATHPNSASDVGPQLESLMLRMVFELNCKFPLVLADGLPSVLVTTTYIVLHIIALSQQQTPGYQVYR